MKLFRHRRPSLKTILGVTKAKKRLKKELGITALLKPFRWWGNTKRTFKRRIGYESEAWRILRNGIPKPGGCLISLLGIILAFAIATYSVKVIVASREWEPSAEIFGNIHKQAAPAALPLSGVGWVSILIRSLAVLEVRTLDGEFDGLYLACLFYAAAQEVTPGEDIGIDFSREYQKAKEKK